ncbi:MAG: CBS domain-containing protein [Thermoplasmata archaeon]
MKVSECMRKRVITLPANATIKDAVDTLARHNISGAPVVDEKGNLVGIISETDIFEKLRTEFRELRLVFPNLPLISVSFVEIPKEKKAREIYEELVNTKVSEIMTKDVVTASPDDDVGQVIQLMVKHKVNRIPIITDHKIKGIITRGDILKALSKGKDER